MIAAPTGRLGRREPLGRGRRLIGRVAPCAVDIVAASALAHGSVRVPDVYAPATAREWGRITVADGVEIAYTERGSGPPLVLVPGWTLSGEVFEHQLAGLGPRWRAITFDPRSHGRSTVTAEGNSYPQQGRDLVALLDALGLSEVHLVGWSYGGLACYAAIDQAGSERLRSLTVIDMTPKPLGTGAEGEWAEEDLDGFLDGYVAPMVAAAEAFAADFAAWLLARAPEPPVQRWLAAMHLATPRHAAESLQVSAILSDYRDLARSLSARLPFANVVRQDWLDQAGPWLSAHAPEAALWAMPSHLGFWDSPADFNERLAAFLAGGR
jgi:pimeloyl-ACP methyl ester carboxylesterase